MLRGFKNFLMQGDLIVIAVGLVVALAFASLIQAFTDNIISPWSTQSVAARPGKVSAGPSTGSGSTSARSSARSSTSSSSSPSSTSCSSCPTGRSCDGGA